MRLRGTNRPRAAGAGDGLAEVGYIVVRCSTCRRSGSGSPSTEWWHDSALRGGELRNGPGGVDAPVQYGPRIAAIVVYLYAGQFLSRKRTAQAWPSCSTSPSQRAQSPR
jgi:hypothetical protein